MKQFLFILIILFFTSCKRERQTRLNDLKLMTLDGREVNVRALADTGTAVLVFISPDCPLCINNTKTIRDLVVRFSDKGVKFIPVYAGKYYLKSEILNFQKEYNFGLQSLLDPDCKLVKMLDATITPEAFVISSSGEVVYSGAIDNWMYATGKKSATITQHYLDSALTQLINGKVPDPALTEPIGCLIEL